MSWYAGTGWTAESRRPWPSWAPNSTSPTSGYASSSARRSVTFVSLTYDVPPNDRTVGTDDNQGALMTIDAESPTPRSAVMAWWRSMQNEDVGAIERHPFDDYLSAGGPGSEAGVGKD